MVEPAAKGFKLLHSSPGPMSKESFVHEKEDSARSDLRDSARQFLEFQRGFLRRRWASYYAIWASAVTGYFLVPFLLGLTGFASLPLAIRLLTFAGIDLVLTGTALAVTVLLWGLATRTSDVRDAAGGRRSLTGSRNLVRFAITLAVVVGAVAVSTRSEFASFLVGDTSLLILSFLLLLHLRRAFQPIPFEGWLAASSYITAAAFSYVSLLLLDFPLGHEIAWSAAAVVWFGCAAFARFGVRESVEGS